MFQKIGDRRTWYKSNYFTDLFKLIDPIICKVILIRSAQYIFLDRYTILRVL